MKKTQKIIFGGVLLILVLIYSVASAQRPTYGLQILKTTSLYGRNIAWDGQHMWFDDSSGANAHEIINMDIETGNVSASFEIPIDEFIYAMEWDSEALFVVTDKGVKRYLPDGKLIETFNLPYLDGSSVNSIELDTTSIWLGTRDNIYQVTPTVNMQIIKKINITKLGFFITSMEKESQYFWLGVGVYNKDNAYPAPPSRYDRILKFDLATETILEEYVLPTNIDYIADMEWINDPVHGAVLLGLPNPNRLTGGSSGELYHFTLGTEAWITSYFPIARKVEGTPTITPTPTRTVTP